MTAAATIAAEPIPDSFEKMPRAMPNWIACATTAPVKPPTAAVPVKSGDSLIARFLDMGSVSVRFGD